MTGGLNSAAIFARLGVPPGDADFELVACKHCGYQYLADHESLRVYFVPNDLRVFCLNIAGEPWPACRGCGNPDWDFLPANSVAPEWQWVYRPAEGNPT